MDPIFVVGAGRSGTTLLRLLLNAHPAIYCGPEDQLALRHFHEWWRADPRLEVFLRELFTYDTASGPLVRLWGLDGARAELERELRGAEPHLRTWMAVVERAVLARLAPGKSRWCLKTPHYVFHLEVLRRLYPSLRVVHLVRDGRDVALSYLNSPLRSQLEPADYVGGAHYWRRCNRAAEHFAARHPELVLRLRYEDLVAATAERCRALCAFVGEPYAPEMLEYHRDNRDLALIPANERAWHQKTGQPVDAANVEKWRTAVPPDDLARFQLVAGADLRRYGYPLVPVPARTLLRTWPRARAQSAALRVRQGVRDTRRRLYLLARRARSRLHS